MLHFEVELEVAYELSSRLHYIIYIIYQILFFFSTWYVTRSNHTYQAGSYLDIFSWGGGNMGWYGVQVGAVIRESNMGEMGWCGVGAV